MTQHLKYFDACLPVLFSRSFYIFLQFKFFISSLEIELHISQWLLFILIGCIEVFLSRATFFIAVVLFAEDVILEDFMKLVTTSEQKIVQKALRNFSGLMGNQQENLLDFFQTHGLLEVPKESEIRSQISAIARNLLQKDPSDLIKKIRDGIPQFCEGFFRDLSLETLNILYKRQMPSNAKIIKCLQTDPVELTNIQNQAYYFLKTYIQNLSTDDLMTFVFFVTASYSMPNLITISLVSNRLTPVAHTCSSLLELPICYNTYQELRHQLDAILHNENAFEYTLL